MHTFLERSYPSVYKQLEWERVRGGGAVLRCAGLWHGCPAGAAASGGAASERWPPWLPDPPPPPPPPATEQVANYSLLFLWRGSDPALRPLLLM